MILTVVWDPHGLHLIDFLRKSSKLNAGHYLSHILSPLLEIFAPYQDGPRRHVLIHADNARLHRDKTVIQFLDHNSRRHVPHPLYSPDLVLSDFWLFGYFKGMLQGISFDEPDELLSAIEKCCADSMTRFWMWYFQNR
jgi:hypothetical protein